MSTRWVIGDAFDAVGDLEPGSIDAVVMHPPYFLLGDARLDASCGLSYGLHDYVDRIVDLCKRIAPALKPSARIAYAMGDTQRAVSLGVQGMAWRVALALEAAGWPIRAHGLWVNPYPDWLFVCGVPALVDLPRFAKGDLTRVDGYDFFVWPEAIVDVLIRATCPEGGTVLDPFAGTGTVGRVAERLGCDAVLIEKVPAYAEIGKQMQEALK